MPSVYNYIEGFLMYGMEIKMIIYADVLFIINFAVNYVLLWTTAKIGKLKAVCWRIVLGSAAGAIYAILMFSPNLSMVYSTLSKFLFSLAVIAITYNIKGIRLYFKALGIFYLVTFFFGGGVMAIFFLSGAGAKLGAIVKNGILYFNVPWQMLFLSIGISYIVIRIVWGIMQNRLSRDNMYIKINISWNGRVVSVNALLDTGNSLYDPLSDYPVIVVEYKKLLPILPEEMKEVFEGKRNVEELNADIAKCIRMIPFSSLGRENGMLLGFKPDKAEITENENTRVLGNIIVGVYTKNLAGDGSYGALMHPGII